IVIVVDRAIIAPVGAIVFEQGRERLVVRQIIDRDDLKLVASLHEVAKGQASDTTEPVDGDSNCHGDLELLDTERKTAIRPNDRSGRHLFNDCRLTRSKRCLARDYRASEQK